MGSIEGLKTELVPFNIKIATCNPDIFGTGFNDRGVDSIFYLDLGFENLSHFYTSFKEKFGVTTSEIK